MNSRFLTLLLAFCTLLPLSGNGCCAVGRLGQPVVNADQTVLLIWDPVTKTEHFIRKASFKSDGEDFGFLVPTPTRPQLSESGNEAFPALADITRPRIPAEGGLSLGCSASPKVRAQNLSVKLIERKEVAGFDASVLSASSATALTGWLKANGYYSSPELEVWAAPYIKNGWMLTALRVAKRTDSKADVNVNAAALRITFQTERPLFPYSEPDSRKAAAKVGATSRLLRLYFISNERYDGALEGGDTWTGKAVWSNKLTPLQMNNLAGLLKLPVATDKNNWWLTEFEDRWPYGVASGDLYFAPASVQKALSRESVSAHPTSIDTFLPLCLALTVVVLSRGTMRKIWIKVSAGTGNRGALSRI